MEGIQDFEVSCFSYLSPLTARVLGFLSENHHKGQMSPPWIFKVFEILNFSVFFFVKYLSTNTLNKLQRRWMVLEMIKATNERFIEIHSGIYLLAFSALDAGKKCSYFYSSCFHCFLDMMMINRNNFQRRGPDMLMVHNSANMRLLLSFS